MDKINEFSCIGCPKFKCECEDMELCNHIYGLKSCNPKLFDKLMNRFDEDMKSFFKSKNRK